MMDFTPMMRGRGRRRLDEQLRYFDHADAVQQEQLVTLVENASLTWQGRQYDYSTLRTYQEFRRRVPLSRYEDIREAVMRMMRGEKDVLWRGVTRHFAQSSGTSDGKSKYVPVTRESLSRNHYRGANDVVDHYLNINPESRLFSGKAFILGGSFANELSDLPKGVKVGDLSATLIENINPLVNLFRVPRKSTALLADWAEKMPRLVEESLRENVTSLSGVPSWFLTVLKQVLKKSGASCIHDVWRDLEVFFHGGIAFEPYREQYEAICDMSRMHFINTYNASEGFFATQTDWESTAMMLLLDIGVFYEFIPVEHSHEEQPEAVPVWEVEQGRTYELVVTACNGLWRYRIGDTVTIASLRPLKIDIAGRTKAYINAFGEELMVHNADVAITEAASATGAKVLNYSASPVFAGADVAKGHHRWIVEFDKAPADMGEFARLLDLRLQQVNSDYQAKRGGDIFLAAPEVISVPIGTFDRWLASTGKLGGQRKVPRLANDSHITDAILAMTR